MFRFSAGLLTTALTLSSLSLLGCEPASSDVDASVSDLRVVRDFTIMRSMQDLIIPDGFIYPDFNVTKPLFAPPTTFATGASPSFVAVADLNADGKADLVVVNGDAQGNNAGISVHVGSGDGKFAAPVSFVTGKDANAAVVADFNMDGKPDVAVSNTGIGATGSISLLVGDAGGKLSQPAAIPLGMAGPANPVGIAAGDVNQDGKPDIVVGNSPGGGVYVLLGKGDGTFQAPVASAGPAQPTALALADFNKDKLPDVAVCDTVKDANGQILVMLGKANGNGSLSTPLRATVGKHPASVAVGDIDNSGTPDIVVANHDFAGGSGSISVLKNNGNGTLQPPLLVHSVPAPRGVILGEFTGDKAADIAAVGLDNKGLDVLAGDNTGLFGTRNGHPGLSGPTALAAGDFNGDLLTDVAVADTTANNIAIYLRR